MSTTVLTSLLTATLIICFILFVVIYNLKKKLANTQEKLLPYRVGCIEKIGKNNRIYVSFNARLYPEGSNNSCYTVYDCLNKFFENPIKLMNSFYKGTNFGISLPISKIEGSALFVQDLNGIQYRLVMKEIPSQISLDLSNSDE